MGFQGQVKSATHQKTPSHTHKNDGNQQTKEATNNNEGRKQITGTTTKATNTVKDNRQKTTNSKRNEKPHNDRN